MNTRNALRNIVTLACVTGAWMYIHVDFFSPLPAEAELLNLSKENAFQYGLSIPEFVYKNF